MKSAYLVVMATFAAGAGLGLWNKERNAQAGNRANAAALISEQRNFLGSELSEEPQTRTHLPETTMGRDALLQMSKDDWHQFFLSSSNGERVPTHVRQDIIDLSEELREIMHDNENPAEQKEIDTYLNMLQTLIRSDHRDGKNADSLISPPAPPRDLPR